MRHQFLRGSYGGGGGGADPDPTLLLHFDGSNGSTVITDSSANAWSISVFGDAQLSTADPKFGTAQLLLDGTGDYITTPADPAFVIGTNDFTIDFWCRPDVVSGNDGLFTFGGLSSGLFIALFSGSWHVGASGASGSSMGAATAGQRVHVALTREGTSVRLFIDGAQLGSTLTFATNFTDNQLKIGYYYSASFAYDGTMDEFRFINGTAVWTENFTPPAAPYADP